MLALQKKTCGCGHALDAHCGSNWGTSYELSFCQKQDCFCTKYKLPTPQAQLESDEERLVRFLTGDG